MMTLALMLAAATHDDAQLGAHYRAAASLVVTYTVDMGGQRRRVRQAFDAGPLLKHLKVKAVLEGVSATLDAYGEIELSWADGTTARLKIVEADQLQRAGGGLVMIGPGFVAEVNRLLTEREGRRIDVLRKN